MSGYAHVRNGSFSEVDRRSREARSAPVNGHDRSRCARPKIARSCISRRLVSRCIKRGIDLITIYPVSWRQRELKQGTLWLVLARP
jgi:hypothetical protein